MVQARKLLATLLLVVHVVLVLTLAGLVPDSTGARPFGGLLFGHLADPVPTAWARGVGLALVAATLFLRHRLVPRGAAGRALLLLALAAACLVVPAVLPTWLTGSGPVLRLAVALVSLALLAVLDPGAASVGSDPDADSDSQDEPAPSTRPSWPALLAGLAGGAGLALALGALWGRLALLGHHEAAEVQLRVAVLLALMALGSLAFGPALARWGRGVWTSGPALVALGGLAGLWLLGPLGSREPLEALLASLGGLDLTELGRSGATTVLAARSLVALGFALGLLVAVGRGGDEAGRADLPVLLLGAALGAAAWPFAVERLAALAGPFAMQLALAGLLLAGLGALPLALGALLGGTGLRRGTLAALALVVAAGWLLPRRTTLPISPWQRFPLEPLAALDTRFGLLTVDPTPLGEPVLTLDRVLVTPPPGEVQADAARLQASLDLVASNWQPGDPDLEVLLAGQLTLARLEAFDAWCRSSDLDAHLTWTAPWEQHQDRIRPLLEASWRLPDPLPFDEAQARIGTGDFDLVVVPLAWGTEVAALEALDAPRAAAPHAVAPRGEQPAVVWVPVEAPLAPAELGTRLLPGGTDLDHLGLGLVQGLDGPGLLPAGRPVRGPLPLARLHLRAELRSLVDRSELFARLAAASEGPFVPALASLLEAQTRSSPWAEPDERLELDPAHLEALVAATTTPPEPLERLTWAHLARALVAQRLSGESLALLPDLLERTGPFAELEHALARAYFELLMPAEGAELLLPLYEAGWRAPGPLMDLAWALGQTGDWERAAEVYGAVLEVLPAFHAAERLRAMAELRAGLPEGRDHALELLEEDPEDAELAAHLRPGPLPAPPEGFDPNPLVSLGDGHDH